MRRVMIALCAGALASSVVAVISSAAIVQALKAPFQDGTVLAKLGCKRIRSPEFGPASMPGRATTVQFMLKDSEKYGAMGDWSFGRFIHGKPADAAQRQTCFPGPEALVKGHDFVFIRFAP